MVNAGNEIISNNKVADPADFISLGLGKFISSANALQLITPLSEVDDMDVAKIISATKRARFIIDVKQLTGNRATSQI